MRLSLRRRAPEVGWRPQTQQVGSVAVDLMNDPLAVGEFAYAAPFWRPDNDAVMHIWAYAQYCGTAEGYIVAFRVDRMHEDAELLDDCDSTTYADPAWGEWFPSASTAESNALQAAMLLAMGDRCVAVTLYAEPDVIDNWFEWDGVPAG